MHKRPLLPEADALPGVSSLQWHLRALLLQADASSDLPAMRWYMRALLLQTHALSLHAHRPARILPDALLRRPVSPWCSSAFSRSISA